MVSFFVMIKEYHRFLQKGYSFIENFQLTSKMEMAFCAAALFVYGLFPADLFVIGFWTGDAELVGVPVGKYTNDINISTFP